MKALEKTVERLTVDLDKTNKELAEFKVRAGGAAGGAQKLAVGLAKAAAAYFTIQKAAELAGNAIRESIARDTAQQQLSILAKQFGEVESAIALTERAAAKFGLGITETTGQITQTYARLRPLGATLEEVETVFNGFNTAARLGGSTAAEASGAFLQLSQALGSGYLRGQEFNSVAEQAPMVLQAIAKETNKSVGELKEFAAQGGITSRIVLKALKRIETEGADQLAEAMNTPQQAIKDLQNAAEDLNVEVGRLVQPAVLTFVRELTGVLKSLVTEVQKTQRAINNLMNLLQPLIDLGNQVAEAFDRMGVSLNGFVGEVLKSLPGIGQIIRAMETLGLLRDQLAGKDLQQNYSVGGIEYDFATGRAINAPMSMTGGLMNQDLPTSTKTDSSAADKAAKAAAQEAERVAETLLKREQLVERLEKQLEIQNAVTDVGKETAKLELEILEINQKYDNLLRDETDELIRQNTERARALELQMAQADAAQAFVNNSNFGEMSKWYEEQSGMVQQLGGEYEQLASGIASDMTGAFKSIIDGSKSAEEAFSEMLKNMASRFLDMAMQILQDALTQQLMSLFGNLFNGVGGGASGGFGVTPATSGMSFFAEGGFVDSPTQATLGEAGEPEYVIPQSKFNSAMERYSSGMRGEAVTAGASEYGSTEEGEMGSGSGNAAINVNYSGPIMRMDNTDYVKTSELPGIINQSAKAGEARALGRLRTSVGVRRKLGMS